MQKQAGGIYMQAAFYFCWFCIYIGSFLLFCFLHICICRLLSSILVYTCRLPSITLGLHIHTRSFLFFCFYIYMQAAFYSIGFEYTCRLLSILLVLHLHAGIYLFIFFVWLVSRLTESMGTQLSLIIL
jgi:hypothetical protein